MVAIEKTGFAATKTELAALKSAGFFRREKCFDEEEIFALEELADAAVARYNARVDDEGNRADAISKADKISFVNSGRDDSDAAAGLFAFATQPKMAELARSIIGLRAAHFAYQLVYKFPENRDPFPWHQDDEYTRSSTGYYTAWLAINEVTEANGCLRVFPGRSLDSLETHEKTALGFACWAADHPEQGVPVPLSRGSIVVFSSYLPHCSGGNLTADYRKGMVMAFMNNEARSGKNNQRIKTIPYPV